MVTSEFNQSNPTTNNQCDFGQPIVNTDTAQIENVRKLLKAALRKQTKVITSPYLPKPIFFTETDETISVK